MGFKTSVCIEAMYTELPFLDRFKAAKDDGFDYAEFWQWRDKDIDALKAAADAAGIGISVFSGDADFSLVNPAEKNDYLSFLEKSADVAVKLGAKGLMLHSNSLDSEGTVLNSFDDLSDTVKTCAMFDMLCECAKIGQKTGVCMYLEPLNITVDHPGYYLSSSQVAAEMIQLIGSDKLKILYDVYHMQINEGSLCASIAKYADQIGHIHFADFPGRHEPGTGEINYKTVLECIGKTNYKGMIGYELFPETDTQTAVKAIMKLH